MILVVGATGLLGSEICRRLRARGQPVRGLVRRGSAGEAALSASGVEISIGDLRVRADVEAACRGVDAVVTTATAMASKDKSLTLRDIDRDGQLRLVEIAKASGAKKFVYISLSPNLGDAAPLVRYKREVERAVQGSGMQFTILQPPAFMEVWLSAKLGWDHDARRALVFGAGDGPIGYISLADVAEYAVRSVDDPRLANRVLPIAGPEHLTPNEALKLFERAAGQPYRATRIPRPILALLAPAVGWFNEMIASGMSMGAQSARGDVIDSPLQREIALELKSVSEYAETVVRR